MKKSVLIATAFSAVVLLSCQKEKLEQKQISYESQMKVKSVTNGLEGADERRIAFNLLTAEEKAAVWQEHFDFCLNNLELNWKQAALVAEAKAFISPIIYKAGNVETEKFKEFTNNVQNEFTNKNLFYLVFDDVQNSDNLGDAVSGVPGPPSGGTKSSCSCNMFHDFCATMNNHIPGGSITYRCEDSGCTTSGGGCGWFWSYACNGNCKVQI